MLGDRIGGYILQNQVIKSQFRYSRMYREKAGAEILLFGNSRGLTFYQPAVEKITGKSTFNLSYNGLPMDAGKCLLLDYLDQHPKPEIVLIDITICDRENDELLSGFLSYTPYSTRLDTLIRHKLPKVWWGGQVSALFRYNNEIFQRALFHKNKSDKDWLLDRQIPAELVAEAGKHSYDLDIHPYLIENLKATTQALRDAHVPVRLVIGPYLPGFQVKNLDLLKTEVEKATGMPVEDYRNALSDPADFGDFMHPNIRGSERFMEILFRH